MVMNNFSLRFSGTYLKSCPADTFRGAAAAAPQQQTGIRTGSAGRNEQVIVAPRRRKNSESSSIERLRCVSHLQCQRISALDGIDSR